MQTSWIHAPKGIILCISGFTFILVRDDFHLFIGEVKSMRLWVETSRTSQTVNCVKTHQSDDCSNYSAIKPEHGQFNDLGSSKTRHLFLLLKLHIYQSCNFLDHFLNQTIENESGRNIIVKIKNDEVTGRNGGLTLFCFCT